MTSSDGGPDEGLPPRRVYEMEMARRNFSRAAMVAEENGLGDSPMQEARELAFKQFLGEWFNFVGAEALARDWGFTRDDVARLCNEITTEFEARQEREEREIQVFDIQRMDHMKIVKLVTNFRDKFR